MTQTTTAARPEPDPRLRIADEYRELPGMCLTTSQAARLLQVELPRCACALEDLVQSGFLQRIGDRYVRADAEPVG